MSEAPEGRKQSEKDYHESFYQRDEPLSEITVDGVEYPFGRIYYGKWAGGGIHQQMADFLESQKVQDPFDVDTSWLCVGHVDEFTSFVPDINSEKGFKMLIADVDAAWELLNGLDPGMSIGKYASGHGFATVGEILPGNESVEF